MISLNWISYVIICLSGFATHRQTGVVIVTAIASSCHANERVKDLNLTTWLSGMTTHKSSNDDLDLIDLFMSLPSQNKLVPYLFENLTLLLKPLFYQKSLQEQNEIFACFESKKFVFGSALFYANQYTFSMLYEKRNELEKQAEFELAPKPERFQLFQSQFIPILNCSKQSKSNDHDQSEYQGLNSLVQLFYCRSTFDFFEQFNPKIFKDFHSTLFRFLQSSATFQAGLDGLVHYLVQQDIYLGGLQQEWPVIQITTIEDEEETITETELVLRALNSHLSRPFLSFLFHSTEKETVHFYALKWMHFHYRPHAFMRSWQERVMHLVDSERAQGHIERYIHFLTSDLISNDRVVSMINPLCAPLTLQEWIQVQPSFLFEVLLANQLAPVPLRHGLLFSFKDHMDILSHLILEEWHAGSEPWKALQVMEVLLTSNSITADIKAAFFGQMQTTHLDKLYAFDQKRYTDQAFPLDLFLSGYLPLSFYSNLSLSDFLSILPRKEIPAHFSSFENLTGILRARQSNASTTTIQEGKNGAIYLFPRLFRCELACTLATLSSSTEEKDAFLSAFKPLDWTSFQAMPASRQFYYLQIGYLDTPEIYTRMTKTLMASIVNATIQRKQDYVYRHADFVQFVQSHPMTLGSQVEAPSDRLTKKALTALLSPYERHTIYTLYWDLLKMCTSKTATSSPPGTRHSSSSSRPLAPPSPSNGEANSTAEVGSDRSPLFLDNPAADIALAAASLTNHSSHATAIREALSIASLTMAGLLLSFFQG